jgi:hypothetical protein
MTAHGSLDPINKKYQVNLPDGGRVSTWMGCVVEVATGWLLPPLLLLLLVVLALLAGLQALVE